MDKQISIRLWILDFPQRSSLFCFALRLGRQPLWDHCPFTSGLCSWRNVDDVDSFNWTLHSGCTPSNYTGPNCLQGNRNKLTLKLLERLDRCYAEVHYGTVYGFFYWLSRDYVEKWVSGAFHSAQNSVNFGLEYLGPTLKMVNFDRSAYFGQQ